MSICETGLKSKIKGGEILISISADHKLIKLANTIRWYDLAALVLPDIKKTTSKLKWWLGRPLQLRTHLGVYILHQLYDFKDRQAEDLIRENAAYQLFCGKEVVKKWRCPDHTKIEEFRSRLSPDTQCMIANKIAQLAVGKGFATAGNIDIDSTVQEANMAYPSDAHLLVKLSTMAKKVASYLNKKISCFTLSPIDVDLKKVKSIARTYFFSKQEKDKKSDALSDLWCCAHDQLTKLTKIFPVLLDYDWKHMPWHIKRAAETVKQYATQYFLDVIPFLVHKKLCKKKRLSFHLSEVSCFNKGKLDKKFQFGRAFQLARMTGNFFIVQKNHDVRMDDKGNFSKMIALQQQLFGVNILESATADKGYYSKKNEKELTELKLPVFGLQKPGAKRVLSETDQLIETELINRRAGIEPLIGHIKKCGQLGKSRMKSDRATESAGYCSVLAFNLRQMMRYLSGEVPKPC